MLKGLGGLGDMAKMMKSAQEMQGKLAELQAGFETTLVFGECAGGVVKVTANAKGAIMAIDINPNVISSAEKDEIEDLILVAIKDAQAQGAEHMQREMSNLTQSMGLPDDMQLPI